MTDEGGIIRHPEQREGSEKLEPAPHHRNAELLPKEKPNFLLHLVITAKIFHCRSELLYSKRVKSSRRRRL